MERKGEIIDVGNRVDPATKAKVNRKRDCSSFIVIFIIIIVIIIITSNDHTLQSPLRGFHFHCRGTDRKLCEREDTSDVVIIVGLGEPKTKEYIPGLDVSWTCKCK